MMHFHYDQSCPVHTPCPCRLPQGSDHPFFDDLGDVAVGAWTSANPTIMGFLHTSPLLPMTKSFARHDCGSVSCASSELSGVFVPMLPHTYLVHALLTSPCTTRVSWMTQGTWNQAQVKGGVAER